MPGKLHDGHRRGSYVDIEVGVSIVAPEIFEGEEVTESADIWSLGCTVLELIDGKYPYAELGPMNAMFRIIEDAHPPFPAGISTVLLPSRPSSSIR